MVVVIEAMEHKLVRLEMKTISIIVPKFQRLGQIAAIIQGLQ